MKNIAVFASGGGSNFKSLHRHVKSGEIPGRIVLSISNNPDSGAIKYARKYNISTLIINKVHYANPVDREKFLIHALIDNEVNLICLAGYMKMIPNNIVAHFADCILNIHPALLPNFGGKGFYGMKVHEAVIAAGVKESGVTIHFVDEEYDHGKIIVQKKVEVRPGETVKSLAERVLKIEHDLYPRVIQAFCRNNGIWANNHPIIEINIEN